MSPSNSAKAIDTEGQVVFDPQILKRPFATDPRSIGYCNVMYKFHDKPVLCHIKVRLDEDSDTIWVTPYNPELQGVRFVASSHDSNPTYYLKKILVTKETWKNWKDGHKAFERSRAQTMPTQANHGTASGQSDVEDSVDKPAIGLADLLPHSGADQIGKNVDSYLVADDAHSISSEDATSSDGLSTQSAGGRVLDSRVLLFNWPSAQSIKEQQPSLMAGSYPGCALHGAVRFPDELMLLSGSSEHAQARDTLVSKLVETEYTEGRTADVGAGIQMCSSNFTEQLKRIHRQRTAVRTNLFARECFADAMTEETVNEIARGQVNAAKGNDELREFQLNVRKQFLRNIREFSLEEVKRPSFGLGEKRAGPVEAYAFYVISPDPDTLTHHLDFID